MHAVHDELVSGGSQLLCVEPESCDVLASWVVVPESCVVAPESCAVDPASSPVGGGKPLSSPFVAAPESVAG